MKIIKKVSNPMRKIVFNAKFNFFRNPYYYNLHVLEILVRDRQVEEKDTIKILIKNQNEPSERILKAYLEKKNKAALYNEALVYLLENWDNFKFNNKRILTWIVKDKEIKLKSSFLVYLYY